MDVQVALPETPASLDPSFHGFLVEERSRDAVFDQDVLVIHRPTSPVPFEVFVTSHWLTAQALARRQQFRSEVLERKVPVPTPEDFVLMKSAFMVASTRSRRKGVQDALDIEGVADARRGEWDAAYVEVNARRLGTWDALRPLLSENA